MNSTTAFKFGDIYRVLSSVIQVPVHVEQACKLTEESYRTIYDRLSQSDQGTFQSACEDIVEEKRIIQDMTKARDARDAREAREARDVGHMCTLALRNLKIILMYQHALDNLPDPKTEKFYRLSLDEKCDLVEKLHSAGGQLREGYQKQAFFHLIRKVPLHARDEAYTAAVRLASKCTTDMCALTLLAVKIPHPDPLLKLQCLDRLLERVRLKDDRIFAFNTLRMHPGAIFPVQPLLVGTLQFTCRELEELLGVVERHFHLDPESLTASIPLLESCMDSLDVAKIVTRVAILMPEKRMNIVSQVAKKFPEPASSNQVYQELIKVAPVEREPEALQPQPQGVDDILSLISKLGFVQ